MGDTEIGVRPLFQRGKPAPRRLARLPACKFFSSNKACPKNRAGLRNMEFSKAQHPYDTRPGGVSDGRSDAPGEYQSAPEKPYKPGTDALVDQVLRQSTYKTDRGAPEHRREAKPC
jgi:hypothetical protein